MTKKQVLRKITDLLAKEMAQFGFRPSSKEQGFTKKTNDALFFYQLLIYDRTVLLTGEKGFLIEPYIWINVKEIEIYYKEITLNNFLQTEESYVTIGNSIANLLANPDGRYRARNKSLGLIVFQEADIALAVAQLWKQFTEVGLPYCLKNATAAVVDQLVNTEPHEYKVHTPNDNYRILKGLIAAKLNNNPQLDELMRIYDRQIVERDMYNAKEEMVRLKSILPMIRSSVTF